MEDDLKQLLFEKARQKFGDIRAEELKAQLEKLAADLKAIHGYPLTIEDEL